MTLLLMGVERLLSCFCRRYLVANSWIEVGAKRPRGIQPTRRDCRCELAGGVCDRLGNGSWAASWAEMGNELGAGSWLELGNLKTNSGIND
jgi:hypothetical protein